MIVSPTSEGVSILSELIIPVCMQNSHLFVSVCKLMISGNYVLSHENFVKYIDSI